jgi:hypothetical protein
VRRLETLSILLFAVCALSCSYWGPDDQFGGRGPATVTAPAQTIAAAGSPCDPQRADPCGGSSLVCTPLLADGGFACELPGAFYSCQSGEASACTAGLSCALGSCLESCHATADCADPLTICAPFGDVGADAGSFCLVNQCAASDGFGIWAACAAETADGGDGTCVPLGFGVSGGAPGEPRSACQQAGNVPLGGACQFYRADGGPGFCATGLVCMVDAIGDNHGICMAACDELGTGGPSCASGTSCVATTIPLPPPAVSLLDWVSLTGACAESCTLTTDGGTTGVDGGSAADGSCPAPTTCMNGSITRTADDVCLP